MVFLFGFFSSFPQRWVNISSWQCIWQTSYILMLFVFYYIIISHVAYRILLKESFIKI